MPSAWPCTSAPAAGSIHHSDHDVQHTSSDFGRTLRTSGVVTSMGSIGDTFDNTMAESFFATLKEEMIYRRAWPTRHELEMEVYSYIEGFYHPLPRHSRLGNLDPTAYEQQLTTQTEASGWAGVTPPDRGQPHYMTELAQHDHTEVLVLERTVTPIAVARLPAPVLLHNRVVRSIGQPAQAWTSTKRKINKK